MYRSRLRRAAPSRRGLLQFDELERRTLLSFFEWTNRGDDGFGRVFGANADSARRVVDEAIRSWQNVIEFFRWPDRTEGSAFEIEVNMEGSGCGASASGGSDDDGIPIDGEITILDGSGCAGGAWWLDPTPEESSEFRGTIINGFAGDAQSGSPASGRHDLYTVVVAEMNHLVGMAQDENFLMEDINDNDPPFRDTHQPDAQLDRGSLWTFNGRTVSALFTDNNGCAAPGDEDTGEPLHIAEPAKGNLIVRDGVTFYGAQDAGNACFEANRRYFPSRLDATILAEVYGYTINDPALFGSFYANFDSATGDLLLRGGDAGEFDGDGHGIYGDTAPSNDIIQISRDGAGNIVATTTIGSPVPGTGPTTLLDGGAVQVFTTRISEWRVKSITIDASDGDDTIIFDFRNGFIVPENGLSIDGGDGSDELVLRTSDGAEEPMAFPPTLALGDLDVAHPNIESFSATFPQSIIRGAVWDDLNGNAARDPGEPGIPNWAIFLDFNGNAALDAAAGEPFVLTDSSGDYQFDAVGPGSYTVTQLVQSGWEATAPDSVASRTFRLQGGGDTVHDVNFGNYRPVALHGTVYGDLDSDGMRDYLLIPPYGAPFPTEPGLAGWRVYIDENGNGRYDGPFALDRGEPSALSDANGEYTIDGIRPGTYRIRETQQTGWIQTAPIALSFRVTPSSGETLTAVDFGNVQLGEIHGQKILDVDGDGVHDRGEPGLSDWTIYADINGDAELDTFALDRQNYGGEPIPEGKTLRSEIAVTGLVGRLADLDVSLDIAAQADGDLTVQLVSPAGTRVLLFENSGDDGDNFSGTTLDDEACGLDAVICLPINLFSAPFSGRYRPMSRLSAFDGEDPNGIWRLEVFDSNSTEFVGPGVLTSWTLHIALNEPSARTGTDGSYNLIGLPPNRYSIRELPQPGWQQSFPRTSCIGYGDTLGGLPGFPPILPIPPICGGAGAQTVELQSGESLSGVDFGNRPLAGEIRGRIWNDRDGDARPFADEPGLAGWTVFLDQNGDGIRNDYDGLVESLDIPIPLAREFIYDPLHPNSTGSFASNLAVFGYVGSIVEVKVLLNVSFPSAGDLEAFLVSPSGTRVELFSSVGVGRAAGFNNTTFDDSAVVSITDPDTPEDFAGVFHPEGLLAALDGEDPNGLWQLQVIDRGLGFYAPSPARQLNHWAVYLRVAEPATISASDGNFKFNELPHGEYRVAELPEPEWRPTTPVTGSNLVTLPPGGALAQVDFGNITGEPLDRVGPTLVHVEYTGGRRPGQEIQLRFSEPISIGASDLTNYRLALPGGDKIFGTRDDRPVSIRTAAFDAATSIVTLSPRSALAANRFYRLTVRGDGTIADLTGNAFDGDANGMPGGDFVATQGSGTRLSYADSTHDIVSLTISHGTMTVDLSLSGDAEFLQLSNVGRKCVLSGSIRPAIRSDGTTTIGAVTGMSGVINRLRSPMFQLGSISAVIVDRLLESQFTGVARS